MRDDTRKRLERAIWMRRLTWAGAGLLGCLGLAGVLWFEGRDATVETRKVAGVVEHVGPLTGNIKANTAINNVAIDVRLEDGRHAQVAALKDEAPKEGDRVEINEQIHGTGRHTFSWH